MVRESELRVLQALDTDRSVSEIADRLDLSTSYISQTVSNLEDKQLVHARRSREKTVTPVKNRVVEILHTLKHTHPHIDFPHLLSGKAVPVLYYLDEAYTVGELAAKTGDYRNTVNRVVTRLRDRGILNKHDSQYSLNPEFELLHEFAGECVHHRHRLTASGTVDSFTILWESLDDFLLQTTATIDAEPFLETGPNRFQAFDIPLIPTNQRYYLYSDTISCLSATELACHTLLINDDTRHQTYCLLLLKKQAIPREELVSTAERYDVEATVKTLYTFLETHGAQRTSSLPEWSEFESTADDYGVAV